MIGAVLLGLTLAASAPVSDEDRVRAFELADQAETLRAAGDLEAASDALAEAYQLDPNPYFLFGRGRLTSEAGDCDEAVRLMREFLERYPDADGTEAARKEIEQCGATVEEPEPEPEPEPAPPPVVPPPEDPPLQPVDAPRPWYRDPVGGALLGAGLVPLAVGAGLYAGARIEHGRRADAETTDAFRASMRRTRAFEISGITLMAVGGSLVVGSIIRYSVYAARHERPREPRPALGFRF